VTETTQPQVGADSSSQAEVAHKVQVTGAKGESGTVQVDAIRAELEELRKEAAKYRTENKRLTDAQKAADDAKLSEADRLQRQLDELKAQNADLQAREKESAFQRAAIAAATKLGFRNPDLAARLLDRSSIDYNDAGQPRNLERLLGEILRAEPYLGRSAPDFGGGQRGAAPQGTDMNAFIRKAAGRTD
jgi:hypothetical protein